MSPAMNLLIAASLALICVGCYAAFSPRNGLLRRWLRGRQAAERVLIEDALKHIHDCEYDNRSASISTLAGTLEVARDVVARLTARLVEMGLVRSDGQNFALTSEGRSYALRVIRTHRLWERYLADRTGVQESEWHDRADQIEHSLSAEEVDALSAQLGNPSFDPHGDPIPTADGDLPSQRGVSLNSLQSGELARVVHVEDEPQVVYAQLLAANLYPGVVIRILENSSQRIRIEAELHEHVLAPVVAANLTVEAMKTPAANIEPDSSLSELRIGAKGTVVGISPACHGIERRRLLDLGIVPGTEIHAELRSMGGDPVAYRIRGATIALRKEQADLIYIRSQDAPQMSS